jgi:hypothetical protein
MTAKKIANGTQAKLAEIVTSTASIRRRILGPRGVIPLIVKGTAALDGVLDRRLRSRLLQKRVVGLLVADIEACANRRIGAVHPEGFAWSTFLVKLPCGNLWKATFCAGVVTDIVLKPEDAIMCSAVSGRPAQAATATASPKPAFVLNDFTPPRVS